MPCVKIAGSVDKAFDTESNFLPSLNTGNTEEEQTLYICHVLMQSSLWATGECFYVWSNELMLASDLIKYHLKCINKGLFDFFHFV